MGELRRPEAGELQCRARIDRQKALELALPGQGLRPRGDGDPPEEAAAEIAREGSGSTGQGQGLAADIDFTAARQGLDRGARGRAGDVEETVGRDADGVADRA